MTKVDILQINIISQSKRKDPTEYKSESKTFHIAVKKCLIAVCKQHFSDSETKVLYTQTFWTFR